MSLFTELKWRNMIKDISDEKQVQELLDNSKIKFYCGFDPTGQSLTIGHLVQIVRMMFLAKHGHQPVVLVGGATGLIGDPRETTERSLLSLEESLHNAQMIEKQIKKYLGKTAIFVNNYDWLKDVSLISFLRDYGKHFPINYMLAKDTIAKRLETGISYTEFSYMLLQSIDFHYLYKNHNVKLQFGGSDQWGNITAGLELIRKLEGKNDAVGLSSPLLLKSDGAKFGKSETGAIWLDQSLTSAYEIYQYFINTADNDIENYLKSLTLLSKEEIINLINENKKDLSKRLAAKKLAEEVVLLIHGEKALKEALSITQALFSNDFSNLDITAFNSLVRLYGSFNVKDESSVLDILTNTKLVSSNREAREFVSQNAIMINDTKVTDLNQTIADFDAYHQKYFIVKRGKKKFAVLVK